jgi:transketolase
MNYEQTLLELARKNEDVVVLTAENRAAIRNLPSELGKRFMDFGICEQTMVGAAAGLALRGRIPIVHALATFLTMRAFEFIRTDIGIANLPVKLIGGVAGFLSDGNGPTHQAIEDISLMRGIPGMEIFCPADEEELTQGIQEIVKRPNPCYVRYNASEPFVEHTAGLQFGKAEILHDGNDVTLLAFGLLLKQAERATQVLEEEGHRTRLINLHTIKPIDRSAILRSAVDTDLIVTIEDHFSSGGLYSIVCELLAEQRVKCPVHSIALREHWFKPALLPDVLDYEGFTGEQIAENIIAVLEKVEPFLTSKGNQWQIL